MDIIGCVASTCGKCLKMLCVWVHGACVDAESLDRSVQDAVFPGQIHFCPEKRKRFESMLSVTGGGGGMVVLPREVEIVSGSMTHWYVGGTVLVSPVLAVLPPGSVRPWIKARFSCLQDIVTTDLAGGISGV